MWNPPSDEASVPELTYARAFPRRASRVTDKVSQPLFNKDANRSGCQTDDQAGKPEYVDFDSRALWKSGACIVARVQCFVRFDGMTAENKPARRICKYFVPSSRQERHIQIRAGYVCPLSIA